LFGQIAAVLEYIVTVTETLDVVPKKMQSQNKVLVKA